MNRSVLMSGADFFDDGQAINALMDASIPVDRTKAMAEHAAIKQALEANGVDVHQVPAPPNCQDGVYTANWALVRGGVALMSRLPMKARQPEEHYALQAVQELGLKTRILPPNVHRFSGQGDSLAYGDTVFVQSPYRTTADAHPYLKEYLGFKEVIALRTKPARRFGLLPKKNKETGLPDSPTYDIDLALAILKSPENYQRGLIAYCPEVFTRQSRKILKNYEGADKIEVSKEEALQAYALNLLSTGETVIMNSGAPHFQAAIEAHGLKTVTLDLPELRKGGGSIRCSTLSLDN